MCAWIETCSGWTPLIEPEAKRACYFPETLPQSVPLQLATLIAGTLLREYYDVQNELFRVFTADEIEEIEGHPTAVRRTMKNLKTGHYTEVVFENVDYDASLEEGLFSERSLQTPPAKWIQ
jgi:hypothetical protein